jgi:predicted cupin superfamily sugar epimerase
MVTPEAPVKLHRIQNDQLYHYYLGDPIEVLLLHEGGTSELVVVGPNVPGGEVQLLIPGATFHTARVTGKKRWFFGASTEWPGVDLTQDVEMGNIEALAVEIPGSRSRPAHLPPPRKVKTTETFKLKLTLSRAYQSSESPTLAMARPRRCCT